MYLYLYSFKIVTISIWCFVLFFIFLNKFSPLMCVRAEVPKTSLIIEWNNTCKFKTLLFFLSLSLGSLLSYFVSAHIAKISSLYTHTISHSAAITDRHRHTHTRGLANLTEKKRSTQLLGISLVAVLKFGLLVCFVSFWLSHLVACCIMCS